MTRALSFHMYLGKEFGYALVNGLQSVCIASIMSLISIVTLRIPCYAISVHKTYTKVEG